GRVLGPVLILTKQVNFELVIYVAAIWLALVFIGLVVFTENTPHPTTAKKAPLKEILNKWRQLALAAKGPILLSLIFTSFTGIMHSFLGHHLKVTLTLSGAEASVLMAQMVLALSFMAIIVQQLSLFIPVSKWRLRLFVGAFCLV